MLTPTLCIKHLVMSISEKMWGKKKKPLETQSQHHRKTILSFVLHQPLLPLGKEIPVNKPLDHTNCSSSNMKFSRKLLPVFIILMSSVSIIRLIKFMFITQTPSTLAAQPPSFLYANSTAPPNSASNSSDHHSALTEKEFQFLSGLIQSRVPCNLLVFGLEHQYLSFQFMNRRGYTIFLEDNQEKLATVRLNSSTAKIYRVKYNTSAKNAFKLLKYARMNQVCKPNQGKLKDSLCKLALKDLPLEVYNTIWDVIIVDGPSGHGPDAPGRMTAIYTASMLARATENTTGLIVHDVFRMIEKWFSWEFLCDENLTSSKGKLWNFTISKNRNSTRFCADKK